MKTLGRVEISSAMLLEWLQYDGGSVQVMQLSHDREGVIQMVIEHPDMPQVEVGGVIPLMTPTYTRKTDRLGRLISVKRQT